MDPITPRPAVGRHLGRSLPLYLVSLLLHAPAAPPPSAASPARALVDRPGPLVIAHRGHSRRAPENTLPAFRLALAARADLVELDYHHSREGVPVVLHDATLDRTTDATNRWQATNVAVAGTALAELRALDAGRWFSPPFAGTRLPTLVEALDLIQPSGTTLIERKGGDPATLVRVLREQHLLERVVVQSFDWEFVRQTHALAPDLVLGALGPPSRQGDRKLTEAEKALSPEFLDDIQRLGARLVVWNRQVTAAAVAAAQTRGLRVWVYTIDDPEEAAALVRLGVEGIITNDPELIRQRLRPQADETTAPAVPRRLPAPLPGHPGNVFLAGEPVRVPVPTNLTSAETAWRLSDDRHQVLRQGTLDVPDAAPARVLDLGALGPGWYRLDFGSPGQTQAPWTTAAVLPPLLAPVPQDSPVGVDSATAWFARNDPEHQRRLANLAALAGVNWVRDRLRWAELQPQPGPLLDRPTTYDTAADLQHAAGLKVLQVFHDTPTWARARPSEGGRFAPDLRHAYELARALARRFQGRVQAWEPWNEANIAVFGAHTVDQMTAWQKATYLGFKAGDPDLIVGWNVTAAVPTIPHGDGVLANETWPYYDTYNIHTYDWSHAYAELWDPARAVTAGRPLWITEADRGTPHLKNPPWYDQDPHLERLKAEWLAQSYAASLFAGARRHFHFILGHYHEPHGVQFGLLRLDLTPRPAYAALATVGRCLAGARILGRWRPGGDATVVAFRAQPDGAERDVLVAWAEREVDWSERGQTVAEVAWPASLTVERVVDYLGRALEARLPNRLAGAPVFILLPAGQAATLPLEAPPALPPWRDGEPSPVVLQLEPTTQTAIRVEDRPWSEGYTYTLRRSQPLEWAVHAYNFGADAVRARLRVVTAPDGWDTTLAGDEVAIEPGGRATLTGTLRVAAQAVRDDWVTLRLDSAPGPARPPVLAFRVRVED